MSVFARSIAIVGYNRGWLNDVKRDILNNEADVIIRVHEDAIELNGGNLIRFILVNEKYMISGMRFSDVYVQRGTDCRFIREEIMPHAILGYVVPIVIDSYDDIRNSRETIYAEWRNRYDIGIQDLDGIYVLTYDYDKVDCSTLNAVVKFYKDIYGDKLLALPSDLGVLEHKQVEELLSKLKAGMENDS